MTESNIRRAGMKRLSVKRLAKAAQILLAALREIFDESAYARFLRRTQMQSSVAAYAAFCREREASQQRRPRCC
jgi:hypothetical protein